MSKCGCRMLSLSWKSHKPDCPEFMRGRIRELEASITTWLTKWDDDSTSQDEIIEAIAELRASLGDGK
jgi:hypothetical protein